MAVTEAFYTGNGSTVLYSIPFSYIDEADVKVTFDGVATTAFVFANTNTIQFNTFPAFGVRIRIYRETFIDVASSTFYPGSSIKADDLNDNFNQTLFASQEVRNNTSGLVSFYRLPQNRQLFATTTVQSLFDRATTLENGALYSIEASIILSRPLWTYSAHNIEFGYSVNDQRLQVRSKIALSVTDGAFGNLGTEWESFLTGTNSLTVTGPTVAGYDVISISCSMQGTVVGRGLPDYPRIRFTSTPSGPGGYYYVLAGSYIKVTRTEPRVGTWIAL